MGSSFRAGEVSAMSASLYKRQKGVAVVEFAAVLSMLVLLLLVASDFGRIFYAQMALENAAHSGVAYGTRQAGVYTDAAAITQAANADNGGLTGMQTNVTYACRCATGTPVSCNGGCAGDNPTPIILLTVQTAYVFETFTGFPGLPSPVSLSAKAVMRAQ